ncbi:MAG: MBL fold metallo-hydrolase [Acidobacteria bacterium]|nr:MBL fold metallo-hydrolase [Acidobacteriota bacterium]
MSQSRRDFLALSAVGVVAGAIGRPTLARAWQQQPAPITPVFTPLRRNVGYFTGRGGTIGYLVNSTGVAVVDSQFMDSAKLCIDGLQERSKNHGVDVLINTHHHGDHTGGNMAFKGMAKKVVASARAAELQKQVYDTAVKAATEKGGAAPAEILVADRTFTTTWSEDLGDEKITARTYTPAHTSGDAIVFFEKANVVHMGDLLFNRSHPVIDRAAGASIQNWVKMMDAIGKAHNNDTIFIAGHANAKFSPVCAQADLKVMGSYLTALLDFVNTQIKAGKTREDIIAMKDVLKGFDDHGPLTARPLTAAYDELTNK